MMTKEKLSLISSAFSDNVYVSTEPAFDIKYNFEPETLSIKIPILSPGEYLHFFYAEKTIDSERAKARDRLLTEQAFYRCSIHWPY